MGFWFLLPWSLCGGWGGHLALGVIPTYFFFFFVCVCVCVYRVKPLNVRITKLTDPKVRAKGVFFCFWVISSLRASS